MTHRLTIETRGEASVLLCEDCKRPYLTIENGTVKILSKHGSAQHENILTVDQMRMIGIVLYQQTHPPERW